MEFSLKTQNGFSGGHFLERAVRIITKETLEGKDYIKVSTTGNIFFHMMSMNEIHVFDWLRVKTNLYDPRSYKIYLSSNGKELKNSALRMTRTLTSALLAHWVLYQLSYQADWELNVTWVHARPVDDGYIFNNYSLSPNGLWVNSPWRRRPNGLLTSWLSGHEGVLAKSN